MLRVINVEVIASWRLRFTDRSCFPLIDFKNILEMQYQLMKRIPVNFNNMEYLEFVWMYDRLAKDSQSDNPNDLLSLLTGR